MISVVDSRSQPVPTRPTLIYGPHSWKICLVRLWNDVEASECRQRLAQAAASVEGAIIFQLGPREWWLVCIDTGSAYMEQLKADIPGCMIDISAAYLAVTLTCQNPYRAISRLGFPPGQWSVMSIGSARRLRLADCSVVILRMQANRTEIFIARSEIEHVLAEIKHAAEDATD